MRPALTVLTVVVTLAAPVYGWSEAGHRIIASIAFRQLTTDERAKVIEILQEHPRFQAEFEDEASDDLDANEKAEWMFQQAALYPDIVRGYQGELRAQFHRPTWHYINLPHFLSDADRAVMEGNLTVNVLLEPPDEADQDMNVVQTIRYARTLLADDNAPASEKAVMLTWLFHNVGDLHQPLHSTALFSQNLFPGGDRGGNSIKTEQGSNLHSLWDRFPGGSIQFRTGRNRSIEYINDPQLSALGQAAAENLDEQQWLDESFHVSITAAYDPEIMVLLRQWDAENESELPEINLS